MSKNYSYIILFCFLLFGSAQPVFSQKVSIKERVKAELIYNLGVNIKWKKDKKFNKFQIGVLDADSAMFKAVSGSCKFRILKWKFIEVLHFKKIEDIKETQILYVAKTFNAQIEPLSDKLKDFHTLVVTDSCRSNRVMINLFPPNTINLLEVNEKNIKEKGLKILPFLWIIAKKYEEDWEGMYHKSETSLLEEKEKVLQQTAILKIQQSEIDFKKKNIDSLNRSIVLQKKELETQKTVLNELQKNIHSKESDLIEKATMLKQQEYRIFNQQFVINEQENKTKQQQKNVDEQNKKLNKQKLEIFEGQQMINQQKYTLSKNIQQIKKQQLILYFFIIVFVLVIGMIFLIFRSYKIKKRANKELKIKNLEINQQKEEIESQRDVLSEMNEELQQQKEEITAQRDEIYMINNEVTDSIHYAKRIQIAILSPVEILVHAGLENFIFYRPRDIVSGDFYWLQKKNNKIIIAVADCTGHGVPGAVMSMLGNALLNEIVNAENHLEANEILDSLREKLINSLHQTGQIGGSKDGMDIALSVLDLDSLEMQFAGANNPVYIVEMRHGSSQQPELTELKGDKMPIGIHERMSPFSLQTMQLHKGDLIYLMTDGYADQFGGEKGKKYKYSQLKKILLENHHKDMQEQQKILENSFYDWMGNLFQVDDVLVIGIRI